MNCDNFKNSPVSKDENREGRESRCFHAIGLSIYLFINNHLPFDGLALTKSSCACVIIIRTNCNVSSWWWDAITGAGNQCILYTNYTFLFLLIIIIIFYFIPSLILIIVIKEIFGYFFVWFHKQLFRMTLALHSPWKGTSAKNCICSIK